MRNKHVEALRKYADNMLFKDSDETAIRVAAQALEVVLKQNRVMRGWIRDAPSSWGDACLEEVAKIARDAKKGRKP